MRDLVYRVFTDENGAKMISYEGYEKFSFPVNMDENGDEFVPIVNPFCQDRTNKQGVTFFEREGEAVRAVLEGYADRIFECIVFENTCLIPVMYLNELVGKRFQKETAAEWRKRVNWRYGIKMGDGGFCSPRKLLAESGRGFVSACLEKPMLFDTEEEAMEKIKQLEEEVQEFLADFPEFASQEYRSYLEVVKKDPIKRNAFFAKDSKRKRKIFFHVSQQVI